MAGSAGGSVVAAGAATGSSAEDASGGAAVWRANPGRGAVTGAVATALVAATAVGVVARRFCIVRRMAARMTSPSRTPIILSMILLLFWKQFQPDMAELGAGCDDDLIGAIGINGSLDHVGSSAENESDGLRGSFNPKGMPFTDLRQIESHIAFNAACARPRAQASFNLHASRGQGVTLHPIPFANKQGKAIRQIIRRQQFGRRPAQ